MWEVWVYFPSPSCNLAQYWLLEAFRQVIGIGCQRNQSLKNKSREEIILFKASFSKGLSDETTLNKLHVFAKIRKIESKLAQRHWLVYPAKASVSSNSENLFVLRLLFFHHEGMVLNLITQCWKYILKWSIFLTNVILKNCMSTDRSLSTGKNYLLLPLFHLSFIILSNVIYFQICHFVFLRMKREKAHIFNLYQFVTVIYSVCIIPNTLKVSLNILVMDMIKNFLLLISISHIITQQYRTMNKLWLF